MPTKAADEDPEITEEELARKKKEDAINSYFDNDPGGDRLLLSSATIRAMGRVPGMRPLGRAMLKAISAGSEFAKIHLVSRELDVLVRVYNLIDTPEAVVRSLGNRTAARTLETARGRAYQMANGLAATAQKHRANFGEGWQARMRQARQTGSLDALNPSERIVYNELVAALDAVMEARKKAGLPVVENFFPREALGGVLHRHANRAISRFEEVLVDHLKSRAELPKQLAKELGLANGANWAALTPEVQAALLPKLQEYAQARARTIVSSLSNGIVEDGAERVRIAGTRSSDAGARTLEDEIVNDPRLAEFYMDSPIEAAMSYLQFRAPRHLFNAQLSEQFGFTVTFDELLSAAARRFAANSSSLPPAVRQEATAAFNAIKEKYDYITGRTDYSSNLLESGLFRTSSAMVKSAFGSMWGLASATVEVPRSVMVSKMYGGTTLGGIRDLLYAIRNSGDLTAIEDLSHGIDQYTMAAHSAMGSSVGLSVGERLIAPWQRFWSVATGRETLMEGSAAYGRAAGTVITATEALGQTATRMGGMQAMSGVARIVADRQAKRWIVNNVSSMMKMSEELKKIGKVSEATPDSIRRFNEAADAAGIDRNLALRLNQHGMFEDVVVDNLAKALKDKKDVFSFRELRNSVDDRTMEAVMGFLTEAHNFSVPVSSFATTVASKDVYRRIAFMLTSYARSFALNVAFRSAATSTLGNTLSLFAFVAVGENLYQSLRSYALGKKSADEISREYERDPVGTFFRNSIKSPYLGAHTGVISGVFGKMTGQDIPVGGMGSGLFDPMIQMYSQAHSKLTGNEPLSDVAAQTIQNLSPGINAWYTRLMTRTALEN
jgi:hypothetical protein